MNTIPSRQNEVPQLRKLLAEDKPYSDAKWLHGIQIFLVVLVAALLSLLAVINEKLGPQAAIYGAIVALIDFVLLEPSIAALKLRATRLRECFDLDVLELPQSPFKPALKAVEETLDAAEPYELAVKKKKVDWYPVCIQALPIEAARLICQRSSLEYDNRLRKGYRTIWRSICLVAITALLLWAWYFNPVFARVAVITAAIMPAIIFSWNQYRLNEETCESLSGMRKYFDEVWQEALRADVSFNQLTVASRQLQDELYEHRSKRPLVPNFYYKFLRNKNERIMNEAAMSYVAQYTQAHSI